jgi:DNA-binding transcriptional MocR family regulator
MSLYEQIATSLRQTIVDGQLQPGERLPSTRELAHTLQVHRKTVMQAFRELEGEGWVTSGVGQGTFVAERHPLFPGSAETSAYTSAAPFQTRGTTTGEPFSWADKFHPVPMAEVEWDYWLDSPARDDAIRFDASTADPQHFPVVDFRELLQEVLEVEGPRVLDYGPSRGYAPLRQWLAERINRRGIEVSADQVLIVNGSQHGLDLVARLLFRSGERVLVEEPSYRNGFRLFQALGAEVVGVPIDGQGLDPIALQARAAQGARLLYTMPIFQNPTATVLAEERIEPILEITRAAGIPILEDHFDADLLYEGSPPASIKSRDRYDQVIVSGTFSKILFPGLRLGWLILPKDLVEPMKQLKQTTDLSSSLLAQWAMNLYCRRGHLDTHLETVTAIHRRRLAVTEESLLKHFPPGSDWPRPRGGMSCWVSLPDDINLFALSQAARREGVEFSPGPLFYPRGGGEHQLRLVYVRETEERIREGIEILGRLARDLQRGGQQRKNQTPIL